jgi:hypothetical protein
LFFVFSFIFILHYFLVCAYHYLNNILFKMVMFIIHTLPSFALSPDSN